MTRLMVVGVLCSVSFFVTTSYGAENHVACATGLMPGKYPFKGTSAASTPSQNIGIAPAGFVGLPNEVVTQGIDVSKWQDATDFVRLKQCGGAFVYVRLSVGENTDKELQYKTHWANARGVSLLVGPYHYLTITDAPSAAASLSEPARTALMNRNVDSARIQADSFISRLGYVLLKDPIAGKPGNNLGQSYLPIVLDLTERPQADRDVADRLMIGKAYGAAACSWITAVHSFPSFSRQQIVIFTDAAIFHDYGLAGAPCDLRGPLVWISNHTNDGSRYGALDSGSTKAVYDELCRTTAGQDRCLFQQYTSYGGFALYRDGAPLDLDRFYGSMNDLRKISQTADRPDLWNSDGTRK